MNQQEFNNLVGIEVSSEEYQIIEKVFMYHPTIKDIDGKQQIADLYKMGGMLLIKDMAKRADEIIELENACDELQAEVAKLEKEKDDAISKINDKQAAILLQRRELKNKQIALMK